MRGERSSPLKPKNGELQTGRLQTMGSPNLPGAYIRTLVKQLSSSKARNPPPPPNSGRISMARENPGPSCQSPEDNQSPDTKRARRRVQTRKLNPVGPIDLAKARREVVTALKIHRAREKGQSGPEPDTSKEAKLESGHNATDFNGVGGINGAVNYSAANFPSYSGFYSPYQPWPVSQLGPPWFFSGNDDFALPAQALGLNLNLQDFGDLEIRSGAGSSSVSYSASPPSISNACPDPPAAEVEEMMPIEDRLTDLENRGPDRDFSSSPFDEAVVEFPAWLSADCDRCLPDYSDFGGSGTGAGSGDADLPCMDIEEIEGMDGDWLD
ncbi:hydroxyproline-rich glycoprotein [Striga asiatica]|uniref:Hydroxyproline-rich glycoprotein n=1 Tax=Striga asiatica TaxID=4170 RepID=A0A5A7QIK2_STRAF|nr:hydroxyproline-rich glycoprotein [Striga asiatica]